MIEVITNTEETKKVIPRIKNIENIEKELKVVFCDSSINQIVIDIYAKYYLLGIVENIGNKIESFYSINFTLSKENYIKNLGYHMFKYYVEKQLSNFETIRVCNIVDEAMLFWEKAVERLKNEGVIKDYSFYSVYGNDKNILLHK